MYVYEYILTVHVDINEYNMLLHSYHIHVHDSEWPLPGYA